MAVLIRKSGWICILLYLVVLPSAFAQSIRLGEQEIKAGLLYNFLKYTDWRESQEVRTSPLNVCVFGNDPFDGNLRTMTQRTVNQRTISLRFVGNLQEASGCHLLFINAQEKERWPQMRSSLANAAMLTVSDFDGFATSGGMIEFGSKQEHIQVKLNLQAVNKAGLQVQDRLLKLVTVVDPP